MEELNKLFSLLATGNKHNIELARQFAKFIVIPNKPTIEEYFQQFKAEAGPHFNWSQDYSETALRLQAEDWHQSDILECAPEWFDVSYQKQGGSDNDIPHYSWYDVNGNEWLRFHGYIGKNQCSIIIS